MKLTELLIADIEREAEATRKVLAKVPEGKTTWKPHEKSMEMGYLAYLVGTMVSWVDFIVNRDELDIAPASGQSMRPSKLPEGGELRKQHDEAVQKAIAALRSTGDDHLMTHWKLLAHGKTMMDAPRHVMIRDTVVNHLAHHRGQLTVYLRLVGAGVPAIYGPSADEGREVYNP